MHRSTHRSTQRSTQHSTQHSTPPCGHIFVEIATAEATSNEDGERYVCTVIWSATVNKGFDSIEECLLCRGLPDLFAQRGGDGGWRAVNVTIFGGSRFALQHSSSKAMHCSVVLLHWGTRPQCLSTGWSSFCWFTVAVQISCQKFTAATLQFFSPSVAVAWYWFGLLSACPKSGSNIMTPADWGGGNQ